ncbi:LuxR C-terminal-related transcriptional regulator [Pirellula sp. SH-Sr6A]|uniref:LuxR C-terminal-related transcriptional regulator n=1 Tax=Pirellula sp. SH-Sr6A TaxID=1632865 RepID=UPI0011BAB823|nr:LuxR C-terminal-related transcriptional regulator [Pirellula sp. SH-Sr6A]
MPIHPPHNHIPVTELVSMNPSGFPTTAAHEVLSRPELVLPILARSLREEVVFFSQDNNGRITFLNDACESVLGVSRGELLERSFYDFLTDSPINDAFRANNWISSTEYIPTKKQCELEFSSGKRLRVECWMVPVVHHGIMVGATGILRNLSTNDSTELSPEAQKQLLEKAALLTPVERQVVELVVDGQMNKRIASQLGVALRTIESRRSRAMSKLGVSSLSQLVQYWIQIRRLEGAR